MHARSCARFGSPAFLLGALFVITAESAGAQPTRSADDTPVVLSPFEVNTDQDKGFVASSSLAGGRLAGELKNTPVAYSVLTRDFIDALQLTDLEEMAQWAPNTYAIPDPGANQVFEDRVFIASRGAATSNPQRDFFPYGFNFDSYNIERLDLARGPNSVLFGSSTAQGTANSVTKRARTDRRFTETRVTFGSWQNFRFTLDHNQPLGSKFALRFNGMYHDRENWRDRDYERRKSATLAATWKVFRHTEIRGDVEFGSKTKAVIATNWDDNFSAWDGRTTFSAKPLTTAQATAGGLVLQSTVPRFTPSNGMDVLMNYGGWAGTQGGNASAAVPVGGVIVVGPTANIVNQPIMHAVNLPPTRFDRIIAGSNFRVPSRTDSTTLDVPLYNHDYYNFTLAATHRIGEQFFFELAGNLSHEKVFSDLTVNRGLSKIWIDVNSVLPTGASNPNYLEPYGESNSYIYNPKIERRNMRIALGYLLDRTRWGDFHFNVIAGTSDKDSEIDNWIYVLKNGSDPRSWPNLANGIRFRYYFNTDVSRPLPKPGEFKVITDPAAGVVEKVDTGYVRDYTNISNNNVNKIAYKYAQAAVSAKLLESRLNLLAAVRRDRYSSRRQQIVAQRDNPANWDGYSINLRPDAPDDYDSLTYRVRDALGTPIGPVVPAYLRPRLASGDRDPLYASDRFQDDFAARASVNTIDTFSAGAVFHATKHVSAFVNYAQSFVPPLQNYDIYGKLFPAQTSEGWDLGLRFSFLRGQVVANVIRYLGNETSKPVGGGWQGNLDGIINAGPVGSGSTAINTKGLAPIGTGYSDTVDAKSKGWEMEITANLTQYWRLVLNGALPDIRQTNTFPITLGYWAANRETLRAVVIESGGLIDAQEVASVNPAFTSTQAPDAAAAVAGWNGIQTRLRGIVTEPQKLSRSTNGTGNLYTDYAFPAGRLKGFRIGIGGQFVGRTAIGYKAADTIRNPANPALAIDDPNVGAIDTVNQGAYATGIFTLNYTRRLARNQQLRLDLKIDNLFDYDRPIYVNSTQRPPGGDLADPSRITSPNQFIWLTPRSYSVSATLKF